MPTYVYTIICLYTYGTRKFASSIAWNILDRWRWIGLGIWTDINVCITPPSIVPVVIVTFVLFAFRSFSILVILSSTSTLCWYSFELFYDFRNYVGVFIERIETMLDKIPTSLGITLNWSSCSCSSNKGFCSSFHICSSSTFCRICVIELEYNFSNPMWGIVYHYYHGNKI